MDHEYSVLGGLNRAAIGRYLSILAATVASSLGVAVLWLVDIAKTLGWAEHVPALVLWPITAGFIYTALYWLFSAHVWKQPTLAKLLKVPDLGGKWICSGKSINLDGAPGHEWQGVVTIIQNWDRLRVQLSTNRSRSNSIAAALVYDQADGFRLLYNYKNEPKMGEMELAWHRGSAELTFKHDLSSAEGEYFNGNGRYTFGTMTLVREK